MRWLLPIWATFWRRRRCLRERLCTNEAEQLSPAGRATERDYFAFELELRLTHATAAHNATRTGQANATRIAPKPSPTSQSEPENPPPSVAKVTAAIPRMVSMLITKSDRSTIKIGLEGVTLARSFRLHCVDRLQRSREVTIALQSRNGCWNSTLYALFANRASTAWQTHCSLS